MVISDFLSPADALVDVRASDKRGLLREVAGRAATALRLPADRIYGELLKREALGSTGTGGAVAIPHARLPEIKKPFGVLMRLAQPIDFDAVDGQAVDILFLLLLALNSPGEQLAALAVVARRLRDQPTLRRLREAADAAELYRIMASDGLSKV